MEASLDRRYVSPAKFISDCENKTENLRDEVMEGLWSLYG